MSHVTHLGFDLELKVQRIARALAYVPEAQRGVVIEQLRPVGLQRAVADVLDWGNCSRTRRHGRRAAAMSGEHLAVLLREQAAALGFAKPLSDVGKLVKLARQAADELELRGGWDDDLGRVAHEIAGLGDGTTWLIIRDALKFYEDNRRRVARRRPGVENALSDFFELSAAAARLAERAQQAARSLDTGGDTT